MSDKIEKKALTAEEAESQIRRIAKLGSVILTYHFDDQAHFRNYDTHDIDYLLSYGKVKKPPVYDEEFGNWKCKVEGNLIDGEKATIIVAILSHRELKCITIMDK
jgi:hypothetical protein